MSSIGSILIVPAMVGVLSAGPGETQKIWIEKEPQKYKGEMVQALKTYNRQSVIDACYIYEDGKRVGFSFRCEEK